jgi:CheY-like chemotaxis protein
MTLSSDAVIVLVDDEPAVVDLYVRLLERRATVRAYSSAEALLEEAEGLVPALFVLDWRMPGIDGLQLCRRLRRRGQFAFTPVAFLTSVEPTKANVRAALESGGEYFLSKQTPAPVLVEQLCAIAAGGQKTLQYLHQQKLILSVLKHDLQNLLTGVVTGVEVLQMQPAVQDPVLDEQMGMIVRAGNEVRDMLEDLKELLVVRPEDRRKGFCETTLTEVVAAAGDDLAGWGLDLQCDGGGGEATLFCRPHGVRRALFYAGRLLASCCFPATVLRLEVVASSDEIALELSCDGECLDRLRSMLEAADGSPGDSQQQKTLFLAQYLKTVAVSHGAEIAAGSGSERTWLRWIQPQAASSGSRDPASETLTTPIPTG